MKTGADSLIYSLDLIKSTWTLGNIWPGDCHSSDLSGTLAMQYFCLYLAWLCFYKK